jgi:uncharacterized protein YciI
METGRGRIGGAMLFVIFCKDKPGVGLARRQATRPDHLAYLESLGDRLRCAGGLLAGEGGDPCGSLLIVEVGSMDEARVIAEDDPYAAADVFESVEILPWRQAPVGAHKQL